MKASIFLFLLASYLEVVHCLFDPITLGIGAGVGLGAISFGYLKDQTYCRVKECCNERSIPGDINQLRRKLTNILFGQHIVLQQLLPALEAHFSANSRSKKPLVISFHGTQGTGKNFVADQIAYALYTNGPQSRFVHKYMGRADFPSVSNTMEYTKRINREVREAIADCPRSLFIFDEVDKMPPGVFESLTSLVDYNAWIDGQDFTKSIFIFLSNTAGVHISDHLGNLMKKGKLRDHTKLSDFEQILQRAAYNLEGGFKKTSLIEAHVIDHYIPFLPLEKEHISKCIGAEFDNWFAKPSKEQIDEIIENSITYEKTHGLFATTGCKTIDKRVAVEVNSRNPKQ